MAKRGFGTALVLGLLITASFITITVQVPMEAQAIRYVVYTNLSFTDGSFWGEEPLKRAGTSISVSGDLNGDGFDDLVIGCAEYNQSGNFSGKVFILWGKATGWAYDVNLSTTTGPTFLGEHPDDRAGASVSIVGDVNGDGTDDLAIGAPRNKEGGNTSTASAGKVYIIFGKTGSASWNQNVNLSNADASFFGGTPEDNAGAHVTAAGDVNGDGFHDILIGASGNGDVGLESGKAYLMFGKASGWTNGFNLSNANASFRGEMPGDKAGNGIGGHGDVNGDGLDDIAIGAWSNKWGSNGANNTGQAYVVFGKTSGWTRNVNLSTANASFIGEGERDWAGYEVIVAGDLNADGLDDLVINSAENGTYGSMAGRIDIVFGKASAWGMHTNLSQSDMCYLSSYWGMREGSLMTPAGDVNGDLFDDFLIGNDNIMRSDLKGGAYLYLGNVTSGWGVRNSTMEATADAGFVGEDGGDWAGSGIGGGGDLNGDGYDDLAIAATQTDYQASTMNQSGKIYVVFPDLNKKPTAVASIKAYSDPAYTLDMPVAWVNDRAYVELRGTDACSTKRDMAVVDIVSDGFPLLNIRMSLLETSLTSGIYRGNFTISNRTDESFKLVKAVVGNNVVVQSVQDALKKWSIKIIDRPGLLPLVDNLTATEDTKYNAHYWSVHPSIPFAQWRFSTNATWLTFPFDTFNLTGTPTNAHVGTAYVVLNVSDPGLGTSTERNFTIVIANTPPVINSTDNLVAFEQELYSSDYNSTDDGEGTITWHLNAAPAWLALTSSTGVISGTPPPDSAGNYTVNVSVDDGNGGWAYRQFNLTVSFTHKDPKIFSSDFLTAVEDIIYRNQYQCVNQTYVVGLNWTLRTNTSKWLTLDNKTGVLMGMPTNDDVGQFWVNITASDKYGKNDTRNFTLTVLNSNDLPEITSEPVTRGTALLPYSYQLNATDVDRDEVLTYSLQVAPENMTIDSSTGLIQWLPSIKQGGQNPVVAAVDDGHGTPVTQEFAITINVPGTYVPEVTLLTPENGSFIGTTTPALSWSVFDPDSDTVFFDVFLSTNEQLVSKQDASAKIAREQLVQTLYIPPNLLDKGAVYYWTVIPFDGQNMGESVSGVCSFTVGQDAVPDNKPKTVLNAPTNGRLLYQFPVQLKWSGAVFGDGPMTYNIYMGTDMALVMNLDTDARVSAAGIETAFIAKDLKKGIPYYWTVIPTSDGEMGECLSGLWTFTVASTAIENHAPVVSSLPISQVVAGSTYQYQITATDLDAGDKIGFTLIKRPEGMVIDTTLGLIVWGTATEDLGEHDVLVRISDGRLFVEQEFTIHVTKNIVVNQPPRIISTPVQSVKQGETYSYQVNALDPDLGDVPVLSFSIAPENMTMTDDGLVTWKPTEAQVGNHTVSIMVTDGVNVGYQNFTIEVTSSGVTPPTPDGTDKTTNAPFPYYVLLVMLASIAAIVGGVLYARSKRDAAEHQERENLMDLEREKTAAMTAAAAASAKASAAPVPVIADEGVEEFDVVEVFMVYNDGRLVTHAKTQEGYTLDKDLVSSMLVAIQIFVKESFKAESGLDSFEFSGKKVVLVGGRYLVCAAVVEGQEPAVLRDEVQSVVNTFEGLYAGVIEKWDGDNQSFKGSRKYIMPLFTLKSRLTIRKKATSVKLKSGVEFYSGYVRLKVGVSNELEGPITDIRLNLNYDTRSLRLSHIDPDYPTDGNTIHLQDVEPREKRSVAVYFDPIICQESHVDGYITYMHSGDKPGRADMKRRPVDIVCPIFYTKETVNVAMMKRLLDELDYKDSRIYAARSLKALRTSYEVAVACVKGHDVKFVREFAEQNPYQSETWFYGEVRETDEQIVVRIAARETWQYLEIFVATRNLASMTGLLAELGNEFAKTMSGLGMIDALTQPRTDDKIREEIGRTQLLLDKYAELEMGTASMELDGNVDSLPSVGDGNAGPGPGPGQGQGK